MLLCRWNWFHPRYPVSNCNTAGMATSLPSFLVFLFIGQVEYLPVLASIKVGWRWRQKLRNYYSMPRTQFIIFLCAMKIGLFRIGKCI